jgi:maleate cis-trans isomerase
MASWHTQACCISDASLVTPEPLLHQHASASSSFSCHACRMLIHHQQQTQLMHMRLPASIAAVLLLTHYTLPAVGI